MQNERDKLISILEKNGVFANLFDIIRLVDSERGLLMEYDKSGKIKETSINCFDVFGASERCKNCSSSRAYHTNETIVKFEYAGNAILLIFSIPVVIDGRRMVAEMAKDITKSMSVDIQDEKYSEKIISIIEKLNHIATTDSLTQLFNRRYLDEKLPVLVVGAQQNSTFLCIALVDLDDFKKINDSFGHTAGDSVLKVVSGVLKSNIRRGADWAARYGGEEFLLAFPGAPCAEVYKVMERIRSQIEESKIEWRGKNINVTASIGLVTMIPGETVDELVSRCDNLLYKAKTSGKNRIETDNRTC